MSDPLSYRIYINPLENNSEYRGEIEVTDDCDLASTVVKMGVDKVPYDIGSFLYDDITLTLENQYGLYSSEDDSRSIFRYLRDRAKVRIVFHDTDGSDTDIFKGFVDALGTVDDPKNDEVKLQVLSLDSIIRRTQVNSGSISSGMLFSEALAAILDRSEITDRLAFNPATDISLALDLEVDDGSWFNDMGSREALDALLTASASVLVVDLATESIQIRSRDTNVVSAHALYGPSSFTGPQNIIDLKAYNAGYNRMFNSIVVNNTPYSDPGLVSKYLSRAKTLDLGFITTASKELLIGEALVNIYGPPRPETKMEVATSLAKSWAFFDPITIDWPLRTTPAPGTSFVPLYGQAIFGTDKFPIASGAYRELPNVTHKLIGIEVDLNSFTTILRLSRTT